MAKEIEIIARKDMGFKNDQKITFDPDRGLWVNAVMGINPEGDLPARAASGLLAPYTIAESITQEARRRTGKDDIAETTVHVFVPSHISQKVNEIPFNLVQRQIAEGTHVIQQLAYNHFKNVKVFIEHDQPLEGEGLDVLASIAKLSMDIDDKTIQRIKEMGLRRGGEVGAQNSLTYAAQHPFGWENFFHAAVFATEPPFTVVNALTPAERAFAKYRKLIVDKVKEDGRYVDLIREKAPFDLIMSMSDRPHYLLIKDGNGTISEPTMKDADEFTCGELLQQFEEHIRRLNGDLDPTDERTFNKQKALISEVKSARDDFGKLVTKLSYGRADAMDEKLDKLLGGAAA